MATVRVLCAVGAMIVCCIVVYPRFMHPLLLQLVGMSETTQPDVNENVYPPHYKNIHPEQLKPQTPPGDPRRNMRSQPHPGMRAAAEMQKQTQQGSGRGMMGVVLPMYAIGIIVYLMYTLFKVFTKSKSGQQVHIDRQNEGELSVDRMGFPVNFDGSGDVHSFLHDQQQKQQLEDLLARINNKNVSLNEMKLLQKRLEDTEAQMARILEAMQAVQTNVDSLGVSDTHEDIQTHLSDLSPDMESYEVIDRQEEMVESKDEDERKKNEIREKETSNGNQTPNNVPGNAKSSQLRGHTGKLPKEVDFDDIDKDSNDEETEDEGSSEEIDNSLEDADKQMEASESSIRQRKRQT